MKNIVFDPEKINELVVNGSNLVLKPDAEEALLALFSMKDRIEEAIDKVKAELIKKGRGVIPSFKGVEGDRVRAYTKPTSEYIKIEKKLKVTPEACVEISFLKLNDDKVTEYKKKHGKLPDNVMENPVKETLVFKVKDENTQDPKKREIKD